MDPRKIPEFINSVEIQLRSFVICFSDSLLMRYNVDPRKIPEFINSVEILG